MSMVVTQEEIREESRKKGVVELVVEVVKGKLYFLTIASLSLSLSLPHTHVHFSLSLSLPPLFFFPFTRTIFLSLIHVKIMECF